MLLALHTYPGFLNHYRGLTVMCESADEQSGIFKLNNSQIKSYDLL